MTEPVMIDASGLLCPLPVLRLRKVLLTLPEGMTATLIATDPASQIDVPHYCAESGHILISMQKISGDRFEYMVQRGPSAPSAASGLTPEDIQVKKKRRAEK